MKKTITIMNLVQQKNPLTTSLLPPLRQKKKEKKINGKELCIATTIKVPLQLPFNFRAPSAFTWLWKAERRTRIIIFSNLVHSLTSSLIFILHFSSLLPSRTPPSPSLISAPYSFHSHHLILFTSGFETGLTHETYSLPQLCWNFCQNLEYYSIILQSQRLAFAAQCSPVPCPP